MTINGQALDNIDSIKIEMGTSKKGGRLGIHLHHDGQWHTYTYNMGAFFIEQRSLRRRRFVYGLAIGVAAGLMMGAIG